MTFAGCTVTPSVTLQFPDAQSEQEAFELVVHALPPGAACDVLISGVAPPEASIAMVTARLPLAEGFARLGRLPRGATVFFAEVRDAAFRPFLRGCTLASSGDEVLIELIRQNRPPEVTAPTADLVVREGMTLDAPVSAIDPDGNGVRIAVTGLPPFATYDAVMSRLHATPGPVDQGTYTLTIETTEDLTGGVTTRKEQRLIVDDVQRPLRWDRLYRGWHGRFEAGVIWDSVNRQLITSYGRDVGVDIMVRGLFTTSNSTDVLSDWRVLSFEGATPDWRPNRVDIASPGGKYGHAMGIVKTPQGLRVGFSLGGSDGSQISAESLVLDLRKPITFVNTPQTLQSNPVGTSFYSGMAVAVSPDESVSYLYGGDIGSSLYSNELREVSATESGGAVTLAVRNIALPPPSFHRPIARSQAALVMAQNPKRLVLIGGRNLEVVAPADPILGDSWVICLEDADAGPKCPPGSALRWNRVVNTGVTFPGSGVNGVFALVAGYDAPRDRVITYGGIGVQGTQPWLFEDAFELDLSAAVPAGDGGIPAPFRQLPAPGGPLGLVAGAAAQDFDGGRLLIYGGVSGRFLPDGTPQLDLLEDVWVLGLTPGNERLTKLQTVGAPATPTRRAAGNITSRDPLQFFGGEDENSAGVFDEWRLPGDGGVAPIPARGGRPWPRANMSIVYNPDLNEHWLYGGRVGSLLPNPALYRLDEVGFRAMDHNDPLGVPQPPRWGAAAAYDTVNHRMVLFGGIGPLSTGGSGTKNDVFALSLDGDTLVTTVITPAGDPPEARYGAIAGYDRVGQRMLIFGGTKRVTGSDDTNELWELTLIAGQERWRLVDATGARPDPLFLPAGALTREQPPNLYVLGTLARPGGMRPLLVDKIWKITLDRPNPAWVEVTRPDFRPRPRVFPAYAYDEVQHRLLLSGGAHDPVYRNDVWSLNLP